MELAPISLAFSFLTTKFAPDILTNVLMPSFISNKVNIGPCV